MTTMQGGKAVKQGPKCFEGCGRHVRFAGEVCRLCEEKQFNNKKKLDYLTLGVIVVFVVYLVVRYMGAFPIVKN